MHMYAQIHMQGRNTMIISVIIIQIILRTS